MAKKQRKDRFLYLTLDIHLEDTCDEQLPSPVAYVYSTTGRLLARANAPADDEGKVTLELPEEYAGRSVRVLLGPRLVTHDAEDGAIPAWMEASLREAGELPDQPARSVLKRLGAVERTVRLAEQQNVARWEVYPVDWRRWLTCHCVVRGRLVKQVPLPDGTVQDWGVCHACVQIYDVDAFPYIIARLADPDIYRMRDDLMRLIRELPLPPEPHWPDPPTPPQPGPPPPMKARAADDLARVESAAAPGLETIALAASARQLRQVFIAEADWLIPIFCGWRWFMRWFSKDLLTCVVTDDRGYFETTITYPCFGDHPDLYFRAVQWIGGSFHILYDPGMRCHTHWNYECGTEVVLVTNDPAARVCAPPDIVDPPPGVGTYVLINRIGGVLIDTIGGDGLVGYDFVDGGGHVTATGAPFGGTLGLRASHSPNIPTSQLKYYRWQYNKDGDVDSSGDPIWHDFDSPPALPVGRNYADYDLTQPLVPPTFPVFQLGPDSLAGKILYKFRPHQWELQATAPPNHLYQWPAEAVGNDIYSGKLNSRDLPGGPAGALGMYWFRLQVYNSAGNLVAPGATTFHFIVLETAAGASRLALPGELQDGGFVFGLHIDNRHCEAVIDAPSIGGVGADPNCGFLRFEAGDSVTLDFHALQPHTSFAAPPTDRATFRFWIRRGANVIKRAQPDPMNPVIHMETATASAGVWTGDHHGNFHAAFPPGDLLGTCKQAAFAEVLRVRAKATNGWRRLNEYDAGDEWAFALTANTSGTGSTSP